MDRNDRKIDWASAIAQAAEYEKLLESGKLSLPEKQETEIKTWALWEFPPVSMSLAFASEEYRKKFYERILK